MGTILFECPKTGSAVSTGGETEPISFCRLSKTWLDVYVLSLALPWGEDMACPGNVGFNGLQQERCHSRRRGVKQLTQNCINSSLGFDYCVVWVLAINWAATKDRQSRSGQERYLPAKQRYPATPLNRIHGSVVYIAAIQLYGRCKGSRNSFLRRPRLPECVHPAADLKWLAAKRLGQCQCKLLTVSG